jgi:hypothetical protein
MSSLEQAIGNLVGRLEAITSRLESVEKQIASGVALAPAGAAPAGGAGGADGASSPAVKEYEDLINNFIKPLSAVTQKIGSDELKN